jgi:flavin reductase (DIM6/NTAB) family NADH-FMN oxidoreductase RutF
MKIDPKNLSRQERYLFMGSVVVPRPIALVSTISADGVLNVAPFSLFNLVCYHPAPFVSFSPMRRRGISKKDTLVNIEQVKEFVINMVTEDIAQKMNIASSDYPPQVDEFQVSGFTPFPSDLVRPPRVAESPLNMECCLTRIIEFGRFQTTGEMVIGEVLRIHIKDDLYRNGVVDTNSLGVIGRMGWGLYLRTHDLFEIKSPDTVENVIGKG